MSVKAIFAIILAPLFLIVLAQDALNGPEKDNCYSWENC
jgi:hypothetical protein